MKRKILLFLLVLSAVFCAYGQRNSPIDLVLLLDTSQGMSSSYDNVNNYITGPFLKEFLRVGDTFHLITFSANPRLDSARIIYGLGDIETIIGRMLIQYPVENGNSVTNALTFAERYVNALPPRAKKIVLITTGSPDTIALVNASKQRLNSRYTTLDYIQVTPGRPLSNLPKSGRPEIKTTTAPGKPTSSTEASRPSSSQNETKTETASGTGKPSGTTGTTSSDTTGTGVTSGTSSTGTGASGTTGTGATSGTSATGTSTATETNKSSGLNTASTESSTLDTSSTSVTGTSSTEGKSETVSGETGQVSTDSQDSSVSQTSKTSTGDNGVSVSDNKGTSDYTSNNTNKKKERGESFTASLPFILLIVFIALVILGLIIYFASRRLGSSPNRVMAKVSSPESRETRFKDHSKDLASYAAGQSRRTTPYEDRPVKPDKEKQPVINPSGPLLLNLFVDDQNTEIGRRNIHSLKSGYNLSVGGGKADDFLIFLVPMPSHIGEIRRNGGSLTFVPQKPKYFPEIGSNEVRDCINKTIRVVSDKNYEMRFRFETYEDPLVSLNRMLMSVKVPG
jgi:flagellar basal body-associated protein FliL